MRPNLLVLAGTTEATTLAKAMHARGLTGTLSFAGRVARPKAHPLDQRIGGFGGVEGLVTYLRDNNITHVVDATHPFAAQMSCNAIEACQKADVPLIALTRPPWLAQADDRWTHLSDIAAAVQALDGPQRQVMLAVGRMHLQEFAPNPQHFYLLRLIDPPSVLPPLPNHHVIIGRGPFTHEGDLALLQKHEIEVVVSKNAGGTAAYAKISAARELGLPVLMIDRPNIPPRREARSAQDVIDWRTGHEVTLRGV